MLNTCSAHRDNLIKDEKGITMMYEIDSSSSYFGVIDTTEKDSSVILDSSVKVKYSKEFEESTSDLLM